MGSRSEDITSIIKASIERFDEAVETRDVGTVLSVGDGIAQVYGLGGALASELLEFPGGVIGMALNLEEETVGAVILGDYEEIKEGDTVKTTGRVADVAIGQKLSTVAKVVATLEEYGAMEHTIVVVAGAEDPAPLQWLAPYSGATMGEEVMEEGVQVDGTTVKDALCVYDNLSKHAWA